MSQGILTGLHVVDMSTYVAGPSAAMVLAQLGADVVRIDPPGGATDTRRLPLAEDGTSLYWIGLNKGKRSVVVDTRSEDGRETVRRLLAAPGPGHGILITNAVGQEWLQYSALRTARADLIHVHITGQSDGRAAVDYTINPEAGLPWLTGPTDSVTPVNHVLPAWDLLAGLNVALAVVSAVRHREATGNGSAVEVSLADVAVSVMGHLGFIADVVVNGHERLRDGNHLFGSYGCDFPTVDGKRIMVVALTARHWHTLVELTESASLITALEGALGVDLGDERARYEHRDLVTATLAPWFARHTRDEAAQRLEAGQVLWGDYRTVTQMVRDEDGLLARSRIFSDVEEPGIGVIPTPGPVLRWQGSARHDPRRAPRLGEHTSDVLSEWLEVDVLLPQAGGAQ